MTKKYLWKTYFPHSSAYTRVSHAYTYTQVYAPVYTMYEKQAYILIYWRENKYLSKNCIKSAMLYIRQKRRKVAEINALTH